MVTVDPCLHACSPWGWHPSRGKPQTLGALGGFRTTAWHRRETCPFISTEEGSVGLSSDLPAELSAGQRGGPEDRMASRGLEPSVLHLSWSWALFGREAASPGGSATVSHMWGCQASAFLPGWAARAEWGLGSPVHG